MLTKCHENRFRNDLVIREKLGLILDNLHCVCITELEYYSSSEVCMCHSFDCSIQALAT